LPRGDGGALPSFPKGSKPPTDEQQRPFPGPEQAPTKVGKDSGAPPACRREGRFLYPSRPWQARIGSRYKRLWSERLRDLDLYPPPCQDLNAHRSFSRLTGWGWNRMQALKGWPPPEEESPKRMRTLIRQWLLVPVKWKRRAQQRKACVHAPGGRGGGVAGTGGETVAAVSGVEQ
jgi:hypothetical protein